MLLSVFLFCRCFLNVLQQAMNAPLGHGFVTEPLFQLCSSSSGCSHEQISRSKKDEGKFLPWTLKITQTCTSDFMYVLTWPPEHKDSASVSFHLCISFITPVSYAMLYNDDTLLSMLLLFLLCSWTELNSHTQIVKHCIKNRC